MRTVKEIDKQIQKENDYIVQLYAQVNWIAQELFVDVISDEMIAEIFNKE